MATTSPIVAISAADFGMPNLRSGVQLNAAQKNAVIAEHMRSKSKPPELKIFVSDEYGLNVSTTALGSIIKKHKKGIIFTDTPGRPNIGRPLVEKCEQLDGFDIRKRPIALFQFSMEKLPELQDAIASGKVTQQTIQRGFTSLRRLRGAPPLRRSKGVASTPSPQNEEFLAEALQLEAADDDTTPPDGKLMGEDLPDLSTRQPGCGVSAAIADTSSAEWAEYLSNRQRKLAIYAEGRQLLVSEFCLV